MVAEQISQAFEGWRPRPGLIRRLSYWLFFGIVVWMSLAWVQQALPHYLPRDWSKSHEFDALIDWKAARMYFRGDSPFRPAGLAELGVVGFGHPPTAAFWFLPIGRFDKAIAAEILCLSTFAFLGIHLYLCGKELGVKAPILWAVLIFSWSLTTMGMLMHWEAIQLSEQIAFLLTLSWIDLRRGRDVRAGVLLGMALCLKLFPGVLVIMLLLAGRFRAVIACTAMFAIASLVMTAVFGFEAWPLFFAQQPIIAEPWIGSVRNGSLQGVILRALVPVCERPAPASSLGSSIAAGISVVLLLLSWLASRRALKTARVLDPRAIDLPFALFSILGVFVNAWTWEHYSLLMITPGYIVLVNSLRALGTAFRSWLDETVSLKRLIGEGVAWAFSLFCVLSSMKMFDININAKVFLPDIYRRLGGAKLHFYVHFFEVISWLPWALMLLLCLILAWYRGRAMHRVLLAREPASSV